jgi:hypothetical protein
MPSHKIHIYIKEKVNEKLGLDEDLFLVGSILPDLIEGRHSVSHYKISKSEYDYDKFINEYKELLIKKDPIILGYLLHLLTDDYYNTYFREKYFVFGEDGFPIGIKVNDKFIEMDRKKIFDLKHLELENYDAYLINNYKFKECKLKDISLINMDVDKKEIEEYIKKYNKEIKEEQIVNDYSIFTKEELDNVVRECINYLFDYLEKINLD